MPESRSMPFRTFINDFGGRVPKARLYLDDKGSVAVEIALVLPILVALVIGGFEVWRAVDQSSRLSSAANAGAQFAMQSGQTGAPVSDKVTAAYPGDKTNLSVSTTTFSQCVNGTTPASDGSCSDGLKPIQYVEITATDKYAPFFQFAPFGEITLAGRAVSGIQ